jgi:ribosome-associated protein
MERERVLAWIRTLGEESFSKSGGPGGQNVNKVNTKVILRVPVAHMPEISPRELNRLRERLGNRLTDTDVLVIHASEERSQFKNRRKAEERAADLIIEAIRPQKKRKPSKPGRAAKERRLQRKKRRSRLKQMRKRPESE